MLGTDFGTFAYEGAAPNPIVLREDFQPLARSLVARILVVALSQGNGGRTDEVRIEAVNRAGGVAEHAVDAHAELLVLVQLLRRLSVFTLRERFLLLANEPRLDRGQLAHEVADLNNEVANER